MAFMPPHLPPGVLSRVGQHIFGNPYVPFTPPPSGTGTFNPGTFTPDTGHVLAPPGTINPANVVAPPASMPPPRAPDRFNPAARAYSAMMLRRFGQTPRGDVTAQWRKFSAQLVAGRNAARAQSPRDIALGTLGSMPSRPGIY